MAQTTLTGEVNEIRQAPFSTLNPNEVRIYNLLHYTQRGLTEKEIAAKLPNIGTCGNRLRSLRSKGWAHNPPNVTRDGMQLWNAVEAD